MSNIEEEYEATNVVPQTTTEDEFVYTSEYLKENTTWITGRLIHFSEQKRN